MGTPAPDSLKRPVDRFSRDRKVLQSPDCRGEQLPKAKTPHERQSLKRTIAGTDRQIDALVRELHDLTDEGISTVEGTW